MLELELEVEPELLVELALVSEPDLGLELKSLGLGLCSPEIWSDPGLELGLGEVGRDGFKKNVKPQKKRRGSLKKNGGEALKKTEGSLKKNGGKPQKKRLVFFEAFPLL